MSALEELAENALAVADHEPVDANPNRVAMTLDVAMNESPTCRALKALACDPTVSPSVRAMCFFGTIAGAYVRGVGTVGTRSLADRLASERANAEANRAWFDEFFGAETTAAIIDGFGVRAEATC